MALPACRLAPSRPACSPACSRSRLARAALARSERRRLAGFPPCRAAGGGAGSGKEVYYGRYGPWSVEREDLVEVWGYRAGLSAAALSALAASGAALLPAGDLRDEMTRLLDPLFIFGSAGLGVSLQLM